jgi:hypothetical protein
MFDGTARTCSAVCVSGIVLEGLLAATTTIWKEKLPKGTVARKLRVACESEEGALDRYTENVYAKSTSSVSPTVFKFLSTCSCIL